ncbi:SIR2 family protein [Mesorhizobium sp. M0955]|uniref:SIR2 family protein n=1 Tax=Mesorhizobium sp. M0955 TaxID=2957033 RepID=UPI003334FF3D
MPTASTISIKETLDLLDGPFLGLSQGVSQGGYAFWLGSGISRDRVIGLDGVLAKLIEFLRSHSTADPACRFRQTLDRIVTLAEATPADRAQIDLAQPASTWPCLGNLVSRLWNKYSEVLSEEVPNEALDYLLWVALDFPNTFASQDADAEHLAIGMLALEGAIADLATANWDGLLEAAMKELGHPVSFFRITVTGEDLRGPAAAVTLYKFHGCALRAIEDEPAYRPLLVARSAQIIGWMGNATFKIVRDQLEALIQRTRTLMIGMSAQDANIQNLFGQVGALQGWKWNAQPTPIVFSADELAHSQKTVLNVAYGDDYEPNRQAIWVAARLQAYSKPLLIALVLSVITTKLQVLATDADAPHLDAAARVAIADGIKHLRNQAAGAGNGDRLTAVRRMATGLARARHQLQNGTSPEGLPAYFPIDSQPVHLMKGKLGLAITGQREAANALGLIGLDDEAATWTVTVDDPTDSRSGALRLNSPSASARVFFVANDDNITSLMESGAFDEHDSDVVVICSRRVSERQQRNPGANLRTGAIGPRYMAFGPMLGRALDLDSLRDEFRAEIAI